MTNPAAVCFCTVMRTKSWSVRSWKCFYYPSRNHLKIDNRLHDLCDVHVLGRHISARRDGNTTQMSNVQRLIKSLFSVIQNSSERWILFSCRLGSLSFLQLYHPELPYIPREGCVKVTIPVGRKGYTEIKQFSKTTSYTHIPFLVCVCVCVCMCSHAWTT